MTYLPLLPLTLAGFFASLSKHLGERGFEKRRVSIRKDPHRGLSEYGLVLAGSARAVDIHLVRPLQRRLELGLELSVVAQSFKQPPA
mgnify:CR=1 FL=1